MVSQVVENKRTRDLVRKKAKSVTFCDVTRTNNVSIALASIRKPYQVIKVKAFSLTHILLPSQLTRLYASVSHSRNVY